jgi:hypothetical protein
MGWVPLGSSDSTPSAPATKGGGGWQPLGPTEMRAGHPYLETAEQVAAVPVAAAGFAAGGPMGGAAALTGDEVLNALINHYVSGRQINLSPSNIQRSMVANTVGSYVGEAMAKPISALAGKAVSGIAGTTALGAGAKEAAAKGATAESEFQYARQQAETEASKNISGLHEEVASKLGPGAREAQIQSDIGRTPVQTQAALAGNVEKTPSGVSLPGPAIVQRQQDFWHSVYGPIHQMSEAGGDQYDKFWAPHLNKPVNTAPMGAAAAEEGAYATAQGISFSAPINKLLSRATELGSEPALPDVPVMGGSLRDLEKANPASARALAQRLGIVSQGPAASVQQLRGIRTDAANLVASSTSGRDKAAAQNVVEAVDKTLDSSGILNAKQQAQLQGLNNKWRSYKTLFDRSLLRKIGQSAEPTDVASEIFDDPKRAKLILANSDKDQLSTLRRTYADWVNAAGSKVIKPQHAEALSKLFPGTKLANPQSWLSLDAKTAKFQDVVSSSPQIRQRFMQEYQTQLHNVQTDSANQIVKAATKEAKGLGVYGEKLIGQMRAAKDSLEAANIATKGMTGLDTKSALQAIQSGQMKGGGSLDFIKRRWPIYAAITAGAVASGGHASSYITAMTGLGVADAGISALRSRYFKYLATNPEAAEGFWNAINNPGTPQGFSKLVNYAVKGAVADAAAGVTRSASGTTLEPEQGHSDDLIRSKAETMAPTPSASDRAEKVTKDLYKGKKPPEVHHDLNRGRLSMEETDKILKDASSNNIKSMIYGMPLSELLDDMEKASPQERELYMPLVLERLKQELPQQPNKTLQANLSQRYQKIRGNMNGQLQS